jgi:hypothetical protein
MSRIPGVIEFNEWKGDYKRRYAKPIVDLGIAAENVLAGGGADWQANQELKEAEAAMNAAEKQAVDIGGGRLLGYDAGRAGKPATDNPFPDRTDAFYSWYRYWLSGNKDFHWRRGERQPTPPHLTQQSI